MYLGGMKTVAFCFITLLITSSSKAQIPALPAQKHRFTIVAHRGDHVEVPENTLAAYQKAIEHGIDYVEIDLRTTKDSVLVIMHDATVDRMTDGKGKVKDLTFAEIQQLKVQDKLKPGSPTYAIPTFEDVLKTCHKKVHIYLDFKDASVQQAYDMIRKYHMEREIVVYINAPQQYIDWKRIAPQMPLMVSLPENIKNVDELKAFITKTPVDLLDGDYSDYTTDMVAAAKAAGVTAWPDIQSPGESANWEKALTTGFTGLQTDHPAALAEYLHKKGLR